MHCILFALYMYFDTFIYKVQSNYRGLIFVVEYKVPQNCNWVNVLSYFPPLHLVVWRSAEVPDTAWIESQANSPEASHEKKFTNSSVQHDADAQSHTKTKCSRVVMQMAVGGGGGGGGSVRHVIEQLALLTFQRRPLHLSLRLWFTHLKCRWGGRKLLILRLRAKVDLRDKGRWFLLHRGENSCDTGKTLIRH